MPDQLETAVRRLTTDLGSVRWAEARTLRAQARRRTARTAITAALAVMFVAAAVWGLLGTSSPSTPVGATATAATPSTVARSSDAAPTATTGQPQVNSVYIPVEALLQPEDLAPGATPDNDNIWTAGTYPAWPFDRDDCPAYAQLKISSFGTYSYMRNRNVISGPTTVFGETYRYTESMAKHVVADAKRVVSACAHWVGGTEASTPTRPAHGDWRLAVTGEGFAGDQSLLIRLRSTSIFDSTGKSTGNDVTVTFAVVRVGDLVTVISVEVDNPNLIRSLAIKAAARLCAGAKPGC